jgi:uncharacterized membrane protein required for colicin V production
VIHDSKREIGKSEMIWIDIIVAILLIFSFLAGIKGGIINSLFSLITFIIALVITSFYYPFTASIFSFLQNDKWSMFFGFLVTMVIVGIILSLVFIIPRKLIASIWGGGGFFGLVGGVFNVCNTSLGLVVFMILLQQYPILPFLNDLFAKSLILNWLLANLGFIYLLLPSAFKGLQN